MKHNKVPKLFLLPAWLIYTVMLVIPIIMALGMSFTKWNGIGKMKFVGLSNYQMMFKDARIGNAATNTLIITVVVVLAVNILGLLLAMLLNKTSKRTSVFRTIFFLPFVLSGVAISFVWKSILSYTGVLNTILNSLGLSNMILNVFEKKESAIAAICIVEIWRTLGYHMMLYLAALQTVPAELYEAGTVDGCNGWNRFRYITLPMIVPGATVSILMSVINELRVYDIVKVMTDGGPGYDTETIVYNIVANGFNKGIMGYAAAIAVVLFIVIGAISVLSIKLGDKLEV